MHLCMTRNNMIALTFALVAALAVAPQARAAFLVPDAAGSGTAALLDFSRGDANTTYQHWDVFTDPYSGDEPDLIADNLPDVADVNANGSALVEQTVLGAFITGGGNIYSFSVATAFEVTVPENDGSESATDFTRVVAQFRTLGTEMDYSSLDINGLAPVYTEELARTALGGFGGDQVDYLAVWDLASNPADVVLTFNAAGSSMSLDQLAIDTANSSTAFAAVPEPASLAMGLAGLSWLALRRKRGNA